MRENFTYGLMRRGWFTPAFHSNRKLYSRGILLINFLKRGVQGGYKGGMRTSIPSEGAPAPSCKTLQYFLMDN